MTIKLTCACGKCDLSKTMTEEEICPSCKKGKLESYLFSPWLRVGMYECGDYVCSKCKKVFIKEKKQ